MMKKGMDKEGVPPLVMLKLIYELPSTSDFAVLLPRIISFPASVTCSFSIASYGNTFVVL